MRDVYRSADGGQTWVANGVNSTKVPTNPVTGASVMADMNICHGQCWYNQMVLVDPQDATRNTVWIGGDLATARTTDGGSSWTIKTWWLYNQDPTLPYAHADHHAAAFKTTGTPTLILGNDGGLNISEDNGASFSSDKNNGIVTNLFYTVAGNPLFPNLVIGGTQDDGTRLRTDNGTTYNQVIGGDGMGAAYSQANTNTVMGSSQGSGIRTNLSNTPPEVFQNWVARGALADSAGAGFFTAVIPAPASHGLDRTGLLPLHELAGLADERRRLELDPDRLRHGADFSRPPGRPPLPLEPLQPRREPDGREPHRRGRRRRVPRHHHQRRRQLDGSQPDRAGARVSGLRHERHLAGQPEPLDHLSSRRLPAPPG